MNPCVKQAKSWFEFQSSFDQTLLNLLGSPTYLLSSSAVPLAAAASTTGLDTAVRTPRVLSGHPVGRRKKVRADANINNLNRMVMCILLK